MSSPLYCLLFVAFLGLTRIISADSDQLDQLARFDKLNPNSDQVLAAFNATNPAILALINQKYPPVPREKYGQVGTPFAAKQERASHEYRITFQVVELHDTRDLRVDPIFTAFIDEITDPKGVVKYRLNDVVKNSYDEKFL